MQRRLTYLLKQGAATLMLLLFVGYYVDVNFFSHSHIINGTTIVHSHIHNKHHHDTAAGGHTVSTITLISVLTSQFLTTGEVPPTEWTLFSSLIYSLKPVQDTAWQSVHLVCLSLRAPPCC